MLSRGCPPSLRVGAGALARGGSAAFNPSQVPEVAAGYWWDPELYAGTLGDSSFSWTEQNGNTDFDQENSTTSEHPTAITSNGFSQLRFAASDRLLAAVGMAAFGWSTSTYFACWFRCPSGIINGTSVLSHTGGVGDRHFYIQMHSTLGLRFFVSDDGSTLLEHRVQTGFVGIDTGWHHLECWYDHTAAAASRLNSTLDGSANTPAVQGEPGTTIHDNANVTLLLPSAEPASMVFDIGGAVVLANGIPSAANRIALRTRYKSPA